MDYAHAHAHTDSTHTHTDSPSPWPARVIKGVSLTGVLPGRLQESRAGPAQPVGQMPAGILPAKGPGRAGQKSRAELLPSPATQGTR